LKKKIVFIVQRYGLEVNGGAEYHCRIVAEKLKEIYDVEILTSCAKDYISWANEYAEGTEYINNIKVQRFLTAGPRDWVKFRSIDRKLRKRKPYQKVLRFLGLLNFYERTVPNQTTEDDCDRWVKLQGPYMPGLVDFIRENHSRYDALIFFTYLYHPTIEGIKIAPEKSLLIPTAHDEPPIYFPMFKQFFKTPRAILYNTLAEKNFVNRMFNNEDIYSEIVGIGVEAVQPKLTLQTSEILNFDGEYCIYIGRIDASKGCKVLCDHFINYKNETGKNLKLVLVGQSFMTVPQHPDIIEMGFVDEDVKITLLKNALTLIIPSFYESLSMVTLESMSYGVPVVANEECEVLKDHINNSRAGFLYRDFDSFKLALDTLLDPATDRASLSHKAQDYVSENYTWDVVIEKFNKAINYAGQQ
jgi:glycosyltransferase involved in cell wall biosynthesis